MPFGWSSFFNREPPSPLLNQRDPFTYRTAPYRPPALPEPDPVLLSWWARRLERVNDIHVLSGVVLVLVALLCAWCLYMKWPHAVEGRVVQVRWSYALIAEKQSTCYNGEYWVDCWKEVSRLERSGEGSAIVYPTEELHLFDEKIRRHFEKTATVLFETRDGSERAYRLGADNLDSRLARFSVGQRWSFYANHSGNVVFEPTLIREAQ